MIRASNNNSTPSSGGSETPHAEMTLLTFISKGTWSIDTKGVDGTRVMAASFIILAFILHPMLTSAFKTVRAHRAWRAIEQRKTVEITQFSMVAEVCRGRGKWDATRIITVLLAVSSVASCGLELSLGLAYVEGDAEMLNRPPPVVLVADTDNTTIRHWQVSHYFLEGLLPWLYPLSARSSGSPAESCA